MATNLTKSVTYKLPKYAMSEKLRSRILLSKHFIRNHPTTVIHHVDVNKAHMHVGDLYGYLNTKKYVPYLHLAIFIISDIESPEMFGPETKVLYIPDVTLLQSFED